MPKFQVTVEKTMYCSGVVEVTAKTSEEALAKVEKKIESGKLQTTNVKWDDPEYEDGSFKTTGDVI